MNNRLEVLRSILTAKPQDSFARYAVAMELVKLERHEEAVAEFRQLIAHDSDYSYAYFHCGQALEKLGKVEEAKAVYEQGIAATRDAHARSELQAALDVLG